MLRWIIGWNRLNYMHRNKWKGSDKVKKCPCCGYLTIDDSDEIITDIYEVCFWQYDEVAHNKLNIAIGANSVSLSIARENFKLFGASERRFINNVRPPFNDQL